MQVEGVWATRGTGGRGEGDLDGLVDRERDDAPARHEVLRGVRAAQDLEQHGHLGREERHVVDEELAGGGVLWT